MNRQERAGMLMVGAGVGALVAAGAMVARARRNRYHLKDRTVLITGGARGLGLVLAREVVAQGARVGICSRSQEELDTAAAELRAAGGEVFAATCDVTDRDAVEEWVSAARARLGHVDVLINNAGIIEVGPLDAMTLEDFERTMQVHFWGALHTTLAVLPAMRARREGRIVNIASIGGKIAVPHLLPYTASKFALVGLSAGLHAELAKDGVAVTTVIPGTMRTGSHLRARFKGAHEKEFAWFSILDSLPGTSIPAERAARQIVDALRRGDAEVVLGALAQAAVLIHGTLPGPTAEVLGLVNRLLPDSNDGGQVAREGRESRSPLAPSWLTRLSDEAAARNNEVQDQAARAA